MDLQLILAPLQEAKNHTRARARVRNVHPCPGENGAARALAMSLTALTVDELTTSLTEELRLKSPNLIEKILYMDEDFEEWSELLDVR